MPNIAEPNRQISAPSPQQPSSTKPCASRASGHGFPTVPCRATRASGPASDHRTEAEMTQQAHHQDPARRRRSAGRAPRSARRLGARDGGQVARGAARDGPSLRRGGRALERRGVRAPVRRRAGQGRRLPRPAQGRGRPRPVAAGTVLGCYLSRRAQVSDCAAIGSQGVETAKSGQPAAQRTGLTSRRIHRRDRPSLLVVRDLAATLSAFRNVIVIPRY